jgi:SAM-dependent methyltransferase
MDICPKYSLNREGEFTIIRTQLFLRNIYWQINLPFNHKNVETVHLDLGAGNNPRNPFGAGTLKATDFNASFENQGIEFIQIDLTKKFQLESNSIDSFSAYDVLEHIPRLERVEEVITFPFVNLMNEIFRTLKPGGIFIAVTPGYPAEESFQDPTHVNFITKGTLNYFVGNDAWAKSLGYGFDGSFELICNTWIRSYGFMTKELVFSKTNLRLTILNFFRIINRLTRILTSRKPTHLLWVLRKPT